MKYKLLNVTKNFQVLLQSQSEWASSVVRSPSLAHLNSYPPTRPSSAACWSTALPSWLTPLPHTFLSLSPWKPRLLKSFVLAVIIWVDHFHITDRSVDSVFCLLSGHALSALPPLKVSAGCIRSARNPFQVRKRKNKMQTRTYVRN